MKTIIKPWNRKYLWLAVVFLIMICVLWLSIGCAETLPGEPEPLDYIEVVGTTGDGDANGFIYSDSMLLEPAIDVSLGYSTDLVKVSVGLASAGYFPETVNLLLDQMEYHHINWNYSSRSIWDNDHVGMTVAWKYPTTSNKTLWFVIIRGTPQNAEWFSNFNLGGESNNGNHVGFYSAAWEALDKLDSMVATYGTSQNIFLFTGHSRGAAVANIMAAEYTQNRNFTSVYGYTFACPRVSKHANTNLSNIHNFNNTGDVITILPLEDWLYNRNGITHEDAFSLAPFFRKRFNAENGEEYGSTSDSISYELILKTIVPDEASFDKPLNRFFINVLAFALGGHNDCSWSDLLLKNGMDYLTGELKMIWEKIKSAVSILDIFHLFTDDDDAEEVEEILNFLNTALSEAEDFDAAEWEQYLSLNEDMISLVKDRYGIEIKEFTDLSPTVETVYRGINLSKNVATIVACILDICDNSGNASNAVFDGHYHYSYVLFINNKFFGYNGRKGITSITSVSIPSYIQTIGTGCFRDCTQLESIS